MKFKRLFSLLGLGLFAAISAGAGVASNSAKADPVNADGKTVYCKMEHSWWKADGAAIGAHYWKSSDSSDSTTWPGIKMEYVALDTDVWKFTIPSGYDRVIFTRVNGAGNTTYWGFKTADLTVPTDDNVLYTISTSSQGGEQVAGSWGTYVEPVPGLKTWMFKAKLNLSSASPNNPSSVFPAANAVDDVWFHYWGTHVDAWAQAKFAFTHTLNETTKYDHYSVNISLRDDQTITGAQWKIHQQNLIDGDKYSIDIGTFGGSLVTSLDKDTNIYGLQWDFANSWTGEGKWTFGSSDGYASTSFKTSVSGSESMMVKDPVNNVFYVKDIEATTSNILGLVIDGNYVFSEGFREMLDAGSKKYASGGNEMWFYFAENGTYDLIIEDASIALRKHASQVDTYIYYCTESDSASNDYIYSWGKSQQFGPWPGTKVTAVAGVQEVTGNGVVHFQGGDNAKLIYKIPVQIGYPVGDVNFKWNNNDAWESEEFALVAGAAYWYAGPANTDAGAALDFLIAAEAKRNAAASYSVCNISKDDATTLVNAYNALGSNVRTEYVDKSTVYTWTSKATGTDAPEGMVSYRAVVLQLGAIAGIPVVGATRINTISETTAESSTMIAIVGIIALVSVSAVSILIVLKKRKIN